MAMGLAWTWLMLDSILRSHGMVCNAMVIRQCKCKFIQKTQILELRMKQLLQIHIIKFTKRSDSVTYRFILNRPSIN